MQHPGLLPGLSTAIRTPWPLSVVPTAGCHPTWPAFFHVLFTAHRCPPIFPNPANNPAQACRPSRSCLELPSSMGVQPQACPLITFEPVAFSRAFLHLPFQVAPSFAFCVPCMARGRPVVCPELPASHLVLHAAPLEKKTKNELSAARRICVCRVIVFCHNKQACHSSLALSFPKIRLAKKNAF